MTTKKTACDVHKERLVEITKLIAEESKRLASTRAALSKIKSGTTTSSVTASSTQESSQQADGDNPVDESVEKVPGKVGRGPGYAVPVPDGLVPELCKLLLKAGPDGISKVIAPFVAAHPEYAKRQIEFKMHEIGIKEKRPEVCDKIIWHIRDEYKKYLHMENFVDDTPPQSSRAKSDKQKRKRESGDMEDVEGGNGIA